MNTRTETTSLPMRRKKSIPCGMITNFVLVSSGPKRRNGLLEANTVHVTMAIRNILDIIFISRLVLCFFSLHPPFFLSKNFFVTREQERKKLEIEFFFFFFHHLCISPYLQFTPHCESNRVANPGDIVGDDISEKQPLTTCPHLE